MSFSGCEGVSYSSGARITLTIGLVAICAPAAESVAAVAASCCVVTSFSLFSCSEPNSSVCSELATYSQLLAILLSSNMGHKFSANICVSAAKALLTLFTRFNLRICCETTGNRTLAMKSTTRSTNTHTLLRRKGLVCIQKRRNTLLVFPRASWATVPSAACLSSELANLHSKVNRNPYNDAGNPSIHLICGSP